MKILSSNLLARGGIGALVAAAAIAAAPAPAQAQTELGAGGATLSSLLVRELFDCYGVPPGGNAASPVPTGCPARVNVNARILYNSVGSGGGQRGFVSQSPAIMGGSPLLPDVNLASSEAAFTQAQLDFYNNGGRFSSTGPVDLANQADACVSPAPAGTGSDSGLPSCFDNPRVENGPLIQIPKAGTPVTVAFDPVYKRVRTTQGGPITNYSFQFVRRANNSGGLRLSRDTFCKIFSGQIRFWNDAQITADNGGTPVWPDPADPAPQQSERFITIVHRDDDSGTTSLYTRALRAQCPQFAGVFGTAGFSQRYPGSPAASLPSGSTACLSYVNTVFTGPGINNRWIAARGNEGVANCLDTKAPAAAAGSVRIGARIGYLSPSFVRPGVTQQPYLGFALNTADLENKSGNFVAPTTATVSAALGTFPVPANTFAARSNPLAWVADPSGADPIANPIADPPAATAYPIVGTANFTFFTCYSSTAKAEVLARTAATEGFLNWFYNNRPGVTAILNRNTFTVLPVNLRTAIIQTFATPGNALNLYIRPVTGPATPAPDCTTGS